MKKFFALCLALALAVCLGSPAAADVIYTPNDAFYNLNWENCKTVDRYYVIAKGSVAQNSPTGNRKAFAIDPATEYNVSVSYTDKNGVVWGCIEKDNDHDGITGWLPMTAMSLVYDDECFIRDHESEFTDASGMAPDLSGGAVVYQYPLSPRKWVYGQETWAFKPNGTDVEPVTYDVAWTDENGVTWLNIPYYFGIRGWICADAPLAGSDTAMNSGSEGIVKDPSAPEIEGILPYGETVLDDASYVPEAYVPNVFDMSSGDQNNRSALWIALGLTLGAAAAAVVIAAIFYRKKKS